MVMLHLYQGCDCICLVQVLSKEEYASWLQHHLEAETAIQRREELLFESALRLETNLQLLGNNSSWSALSPSRTSLQPVLKG